MTLSLGIDTGGTYTDAVIFDDDRGVIAKAKALTTRNDLAIGIAESVNNVVQLAAAAPTDIGLVSLSTTLATNALVEGRGGRVALVFIGFDDGDTARAGLDKALQGDPLVRVAGGHSSHGSESMPLDLGTLEREVLAIAHEVTGFAVSAHFATRNPAHEIAARDRIVRLTGLPVTCGHELTAKLDGPRRALTSVLNARLIGLIANLIGAAEQIMRHHGIVAPLMVVRGDGALMAAEMAKIRPIETILSGPAASLVGASYLTNLRSAIISDIGGTTTDVAVITDGSPQLDARGASVGGLRTMVEAVAMTTIGLGGDSEVRVLSSTTTPHLELGPRRVLPLCLLATTHEDVVRRALQRQLLHETPGEHDARFALPLSDSATSEVGLSGEEADLLGRIRLGVCSVDTIARGHSSITRLNRLVQRGLVILSAFTPTDASHMLGDDGRFDRSIAAAAATLMARKRTALGKPVAIDGLEFSRWVVTFLQRRSAETLLNVGLEIDGFNGIHLSSHPLMAASLDGRAGVVEVSARLSVPVVGLGASAGLYYPAVAAMLRTEGVVPAHADVANAIGAVVGRVRMRAEVYVSAPERGIYRVHLRESPRDVIGLEEALVLAEATACAEAVASATAGGADHVEVVVTRVVKQVQLDGEDFFVEATVTAIASGRPAATSAARQ